MPSFEVNHTAIFSPVRPATSALAGQLGRGPAPRRVVLGRLRPDLAWVAMNAALARGEPVPAYVGSRWLDGVGEDLVHPSYAAHGVHRQRRAPVLHQQPPTASARHDHRAGARGV